MATEDRTNSSKAGDGHASSESIDDARRREARATAEELIRFLDGSPSAYHAVANLRAMFEKAGFAALGEDRPFRLEPGGKYLVDRHGSALVAFIRGTKPPSNAGFRMVAAHTDSPGLKLKPRPEIVSQGLVHLGVEVYGGPILATWADRDLGLCGRAILSPDGERLETRLFATRRPVIGLPNVAVHMNRTVNDEGLKLNPQTQLTPVLGQVEQAKDADGARTQASEAEAAFRVHAPGLPSRDTVRMLIGELIDVPASSIVDFDAYLYDTQPACFTGWNEEFILSGRLDDLAMCHAGALALIGDADETCEATRVAVFYDSEEIGSQTPAGARSNLLPHLLERIALASGNTREGYFGALAASQLVSADNAHAVHPGFADKSEPRHAPRLNEGPVIKAHASRAYATDAYAAAFFELACRRAGVPFQRFVNRSDAKSGSTIGSMTAAQLGVPTADVGNAQYAMHSIREMGGALDAWYMTAAMRAFLRG
ncbi:MAG: M18 family aminopeptidase [Candidatus Eisenbacteria bacterium]|nr:M18 family aminopeptidase [Candidatus Eisenbacteria bacterium]